MKLELNNIFIFLGILITHWIADFILQTDRQAKGKSKNWNDLLSHTFIYSTIWFPILMFPMGAAKAFLFFVITFIAHTATDYYTSRLNARLWSRGSVHNFFVSIGFDQILHYTQLLLTYYLLQ